MIPLGIFVVLVVFVALFIKREFLSDWEFPWNRSPFSTPLQSPNLYWEEACLDRLMKAIEADDEEWACAQLRHFMWLKRGRVLKVKEAE